MDFTYNAIYYDYDSHPDNAELKSFSDFLTKINNFSSKYQCVFSCSGLLINLVHLIIITRKSLRVNSVYVIMIGITLSDLYTMFHVVYVFLDNIVSNYNWYECFQVCTEQECFKFHKYQYHGYLHVVVELIMSALREALRRLSTWLAFCMALFRWLIIRNSMNAKFDFLSRPSFAFKTVLTLLLISPIITFLSFGQHTVTDNGFVDVSQCSGIPDYIVPHTYIIKKGRVFDDFWPLAVQLYFFSDGISKIIPAVCLPFLCIVLVTCLRTARESRKNLSKSSSNNDRTIYMVTIMTAFSVFAEGPSGISYLFKALYYDHNAIKSALQTLDEILINAAILNSIVHVIISLVVSTQYRETAKKLFGCKRCFRKIVVAKDSLNTVEIVVPALHGTFSNVD
ncbi:G-protein coupled receptors family 1 profile domain-containing protein [Caenorhabditis elegans]|uniref:G-protein coupled receptors family 1 profile domain-containing protein n=1 Tax=Caenorhabditis elegans TaxID=6239 RepID=Q9U3D1_CAEEL|nr:G-protein coupled receptors family 1 profile domain-containing protein [Caenorhabditis elegans]CAB63232.2 G-protein coupled receptors family 1 profile domain-containing protein [Caenorhabditis elegans]|eukprot:NP_001255885.1 Serpentine Receptor, class W [Caenorhabditis elegans]